MKILGTVGEPQGRRNGWSQTLGDYVEDIYHGSPDYVRQIYSNARGNCSEADVEVMGASGTCRIRFAGTTTPGGDAELRVEIRRARNDVQKSIFEAGPDGLGPGNVTAEELRYIKALIDDPLDENAFLFMSTNASAAAQALYDLALKGVEFRIVSQMVLTQITTAPTTYGWPNVDGYAGSIVSRATMLSVLRAQPNFNVPGNPGVEPSGFIYGWRLATPNYEYSSDGHSVETLEFEFGLWPSQIYGSAI